MPDMQLSYSHPHQILRVFLHKNNRLFMHTTFVYILFWFFLTSQTGYEYEYTHTYTHIG